MKKVEKYTDKLSRFSNRYFFSYQDRLTPEKVEALLQEVLEEVEKAKGLEAWEKAIHRWNETKSHLGTHFELVELAFQCHTKDSEIEKEERRLKEEIEPVIDRWNAKIREKVLASDSLPALKEKLGDLYFRILKIRQDNFDPKNIELETKLNKILSNYTKLTGGANFEVGGTKYPLAQYKKFSSSPDPKLRHESFLSYSGWFLGHRTELEEIYNKSVKLRREMAKKLGYENFIPLGYQKMFRTDFGPEEVERLRKQILEIAVPLAVKIREAQAKALGKEHLSIWDCDYFPQWENGPLKIPIKAQPEAALKVYKRLSPRLSEHFQRMKDWNLVDLESRDGKGPGAFCTDFSDYRVPFIFLNSVGEASDVTTMLHECGHAFQAWESRDIELLELRWPTLEACEVHSMSMEFLAYPYYEEFFTSEDAERYRKRHLAESILLLPYIAMVDEFQHLVYSGKAEGAEGRAKVWEVLEEKYMPGIDFSDVPKWKSHRWIRQLHIFRSPFYYIDYAIAQVGAWQIWVQSIQDREAAMENYLKLCRIGGSLPLKKFFAAGKLKLPFQKGVLKNLLDEILKIQPLF